MSRENGYIIDSLLDTDFYKFTMGQIVFRKYRDVQVKYALKNRTTSVNLANFIDERKLRQELDNMRALKFEESEIRYLRGTNNEDKRMFSEDYLEFLSKFRLPDYQLKYWNVWPGQRELKLEFSGKWEEAIYWEIPALAIINELYYRSVMNGLTRLEQDAVRAQGTIRLAEKVKLLRQYPDVRFSDFGTRRRFAWQWQDYAVRAMARELPDQFLGSSNVELSKRYSFHTMGTTAHEMFMVLAGLSCGQSDDAIRASHNQVLRDQWEAYGHGLSVALTDTFGSDFFFPDMTREQAAAWKGLRQDSGDPIEFGEKAVAFYQSHGIDPKTKLIVFSDGLTADDIVRIYLHFKDRIKTTFGWGTNLTNDLGLKPLSLVIKVSEVNGHGTVKLSDNIAKAMGKPEDIERYKRIFGYTSTLNKTCIY